MAGQSFTADGTKAVVQYFVEIIRQRDRLRTATDLDNRIYAPANPYLPLCRRDQKRLDWAKFRLTGRKPAGRVDILLSRYTPGSGFAPHDELRRLALNSATEVDDRVVRDAIYAVHESHDKLLKLARKNDGITDQDLYDCGHLSTTAKLMDLLPASSSDKETLADGNGGKQAIPLHTPTEETAPESSIPIWNSELGTLTYRNKTAKVHPRAKNCRPILDAFQEDEWPPRIDDPLPGGCDAPGERMREAIRSLNTRENMAIIFEAEGTGYGIRWKAVDDYTA